MASRQKKTSQRKKKPTKRTTKARASTKSKSKKTKPTRPQKPKLKEKGQTLKAHPLLGKRVPNVTLLNTNGLEVKVDQLVTTLPYCVLYFYPKDDTPGCTQEACDFRDQSKELKNKKAMVVGVSPDSIVKHQKFEEKYSLNFTLLSDPDRKLIEAFGLWQKKKFMGREYFGVVRTTLLLKDGVVEKVWQPANVKNHALEVLASL